MHLRSILTQSILFATLSLAVPLAEAAPPDAMLELFKILRDRGSISDAEYQQLSKMAGKEKVPERWPASSAHSTALQTPALDALEKMEQRLKESEKRLAVVEQSKTPAKDPKGLSLNLQSLNHWFDKLKLDGYTQFRYHALLNDEADRLTVPNDRSVNEDESLFIRRGRFKIYGDISKHLFFYSQLDFAGSVFGSGGSLGVQARDLYADISLDEEKVYRARLGLSKVPFGWVNMQSSQNRAPLERPDALNSAVEGERDNAAYFLYTPVAVRERFRELVKSGLKGSGDYGMLALGAFMGQGLNRLDKNGEVHALARLTYPWKLPNGQFFETAIQAYHGKFVVGTDDLTLADGTSVKPFSPDEGVTDQRIGVSAILYPQPFGLEAEWNWGRGPKLSDDYQRIEAANLQGGYVQANYKLETSRGTLFPFARWNYYDGARKFATNAPRDKVNELDFGLEWSPWPEIEISLMYTHTLQRTDTTKAPFRDVEGADRLGIQVQWNY